VVFQVLVPTTERLDRFLADQLAISRTQAARLLGEGAVTVNGEGARASACLSRGDTVKVDFPPEAPRREIRPLDIPLNVVFEDAYLLVIDKPAGLVVHPAPGHWDDTLVNALAGRGIAWWSGDPPAEDSEEETPPSLRPGIVHRLDKDTSGLMVVAKDDTSHRRLSHALSLRRIERQYAALVWGHVSAEREIDAPIARSESDRQRMAVTRDGRPAKTLVHPVARFATCDLIRARLFSGRTHQIRVHLAHIGHPVVGDSLYGAEGHRRMTGAQRNQAMAVEREAPRQALHAAVLRFAHPETREWLEFESDWPADLRPALAAAAGDPALLARPKLLEYLGFRA
jgi:23S rRNA pseudouridine1911/1915/1917 synthase